MTSAPAMPLPSCGRGDARAGLLVEEVRSRRTIAAATWRRPPEWRVPHRGQRGEELPAARGFSSSTARSLSGVTASSHGDSAPDAPACRRCPPPPAGCRRVTACRHRRDSAGRAGCARPPTTTLAPSAALATRLSAIELIVGSPNRRATASEARRSIDLLGLGDLLEGPPCSTAIRSPSAIASL